ncbi:calcium-binding protein [Paracoccus sp. R86501]|uniref:calcium-binding protein n=1 Tax=Paracoccus sp. R86501 TaxID=3101711 RepID=UPI00366D7F59
MHYEWAFIANWLIFAGLILLYMDPFDFFSSDDDDDNDDVDPNPIDGIKIVGTNDAEQIAGTEGDDVLLGLGGDDLIDAGAGDDYVEGNTGDDIVNGGAGNDTLAGGGGTDDVRGGAGDDVLGVNRLDADADWDRGGQETLSGGAGDDQLYFSGDDMAIGGEGSDGFNMVISPDQGPGHVTDFSPSEDKLTFYTEFDPENPPQITVAADEDSQTTSVMIGDKETLTMDGVFTREELEIELKETSELDLNHSPDL